MDKITNEKLEKYFLISRDAFELAKKAGCIKGREGERGAFLDTIKRYLADAGHFAKKKDYVNAFAALNYAHGWLDAGAKLGLWIVKDNRLFAGVD